MKKILYYFIVMTCSIHSAFVYAQYTYRPLVEEGKTWKYTPSTYTKEFSDCPYPDCFFTISGDTIINGTDYKKMYIKCERAMEDDNPVYLLAIRESNKTVYVLSNLMEEERILYDFNFSVNDSIKLYGFEEMMCQLDVDNINTQNQYHRCFGCVYNPLSKPLYNHEHSHVTHVDTILVHGEQYRLIEFDYGGNYWVEGIGCFWGLFQTKPYLFAYEDIPEDIFRCFKDGKTLFTRPDFYYNAGSGYRNSYMFGPSVWEYYVDEEGDGGYFYRFHIGPAGPERRNDMYRYMVKGVRSDHSAYTPWKGYKNLPADEDAEFLLYIYEYRHKVYVAYDEYKAYLQKVGYDVSRLDAELPYEQTDDGLVVLYDFDKPVGAKVSTALDDNPLVSEQHFIDEEYDGVKENRDWQVLDDGTIVFSGIGYVGGGSRGGMLLDYLMPGENKPKSHLEFYAQLLDQGYAYDHHHEHTITAIKDIKRDAHEKRYNLFDLQGRSLKSAPQRGVYIRNGKKVVVR